MGSGIGDPTSRRGDCGTGIEDLIAWEGDWSWSWLVEVSTRCR